MNAKTERQIENLKNQTIGVEIEMNPSQENELQSLPQTFSEQADMNSQQAETDTAPGQLGMHRAENGNFKRTSALQDAMLKSANWLHRFFTTATLKPCRSL